jgi:hypothetical protein
VSAYDEWVKQEGRELVRSVPESVVAWPWARPAMTHAEACHAAFDRTGLWHWVAEGRRLEHFLRTGRWRPAEGGDAHYALLRMRRNALQHERVPGENSGPGVSASGENTLWESYG